MSHRRLRCRSFILSLGWCVIASLSSAAENTALKIHHVLPKDAIQAILKPMFVPASEAQVEDEAPMIGVVLNGEAHAYSAVLLNSQEIVNDVVGGEKIATTW